MRPLLIFVLLSVSAAVSAQFKLYGLTANGGANGFGVLYTTMSDGSGFQALYSFPGGTGSARPYGGLTLVGTKLYGTTRAGGSSGQGTIFSFDTTSQTFQKAADFTGSNGGGPEGDLTYYNGKLYGVAPLGGANKGGTVFAFDPVAGVLADVFDLNSSTGMNPYGNITVLNSKLYFINTLGGSTNSGSIAAFDPVAVTCTDVYNFSGNAYPHSGMVVLNNLLYGTEINRGEIGDIFSFDPVANTYTDVHDFSQADFTTDVQNPNGLTVYNGVLYGSGQNGSIGQDGGGWFSFDPVANNFNEIRAFAGASIDGATDGWYPLAAPVAVPDSTVVGAVPFGGVNYDGTIIFSGVNVTAKHSFTGADGQSPMFGSLFVATDPVVLPIRILQFTGLRTAAGRVLNWMASQPAAGGSFQLQRSADETNFIPIDSMGATSGTASYSYTDDASLPGVNVAYYRLKMTDVNQVMSYSNIVALSLGGNGDDSLRLINTAVTGTAFLQYKSTGFSAAFNLTVVSISGHIMIQQQLPVSAGVNSYSIDASALPKGMYVIHAAGRSIQFMRL
jgi:uncharacterized repeat protein (TIGR03803 family)